MKKNKLEALINLLDDPDKTVFNLVEKEILKEGKDIIPVLEEKWENSFDEGLQERIENLIQRLQFKENKAKLKFWINTDNKERDILTGMWLINRIQYPDLNFLNTQLKLEKIKKTIWLELNNSLTLLEKTTILNHFFFHVHGFAINHGNLQSPNNCFLNQIIDSKKGNPVSLSILYIIIARMLELPVYFIDFPKNPLIAIVEPGLALKVHGRTANSDVLFYINPSNKGAITSRKEIEYHLNKNDYSPLHHFTEPKSDALFIQRLLESLEESYQKAGLVEKEEIISELLALFQ